MSRSSINTLIDTNISTNGAGSNTGSLVNAAVKQIAAEAMLSEDLVLDNQNGSVFLTNQGRGLFYGTDSAKTGAITVDLTGAIVGAVAWVIHNDGSTPTITGATKTNFTYNASTSNYIKIVATKVGGTIIALASTPFAGVSTSVLSGTGTPEGNKTAGVSSIYLRTDGDQDSVVYEKVSGTGNTGWLSDADRQSFTELTDGGTITWNARATDGTGRKKAFVTLGGNRTLAEPVNKKDGDELTLIVFQDATGGRTLAWPADFVFQGTSEIHTQASAIDILNIVYLADTDKYYCSWALPRGYREKMILPTGSDIDLDLDALTDAQIGDYDGKTIYLNNLSSTGGGSLLELPTLSKVNLGYRIHLRMEQTTSGGELECSVSGSDQMYATGIGAYVPILDTSGTDTLKIVDDNISFFECTLIKRDYSGGSGLYAWGIENARYTFTGGVKSLPATTGAVTWDLNLGKRRSVAPTGDITLTISNMDTSIESLLEGVLYVTMGATAYDITLPSNSKVQSSNAILTESSGTRKLDMAINTTVALTYAYDGTNYIWHASANE